MNPPTLYPGYEQEPDFNDPAQIPAQQPGMFQQFAQFMRGGSPQSNQWYQERGLIDPNVARMSQVGQNAGSWGGSGQRGMSPMMAYQQAVASNAAQRMSRATTDPYYEFEEGKRRGILPPDMTCATGY